MGSRENQGASKGCLSSLASKVEKTVSRQRLLCPGQRILVAVSGGPDSVALLWVLWELHYSWAWKLAVAHVHHGLRGKDAEEDMIFARAMAEQLELPFFLRRVEPGSLRIHGRSLQETAREARYRFLKEMAQEFAAQAIALGHQADDQAETLLAALVRGTGLKGMAAMPYGRGLMVRPLLDVSRHEVLDYLEHKGLSFRKDPSNEDSRFLRVRIRHELLPLLRSRFNEGIRDVLLRTARLCALEEDYLEKEAQRLWTGVVQRAAEGGLCISSQSYRGVHKALRLRLLRLSYAQLRGNSRGLSMEHAELMDSLAFKEGPEKWLDLPGNIRFGVSGQYLLMAKAEELSKGSFCYKVHVPGQTMIPEAGLQIDWEIWEVQQGLIEELAGVILMDMDTIQEPLVLRSPMPGDRLRPKGLGGSKKIQDLLVDAHVPRRQRWRVPVLADAKGLIWAVGYRLDERVSPGPNTRRLLLARVRSQG